MTEINFTEQECADSYNLILTKGYTNTKDYDLLYGGSVFNIYKANTPKGCCILGFGMHTCLTDINYENPTIDEAWNKYSPIEEFYFIINKDLPLHDNFYICLGKSYYDMFDKFNFPTNLNSIVNDDIINFLNNDRHIKDIIQPYLEPVVIPENTVFYGDKKFDYMNLRKLPKRLTCYGKVSFSTTLITNLPEELYCEDDLNLANTCVNELPKTLHLGRNLNLKHTGFKVLPNKLVIRNNLNISHCKLTRLPDDLWVRDNLNLRLCGITELPDSLLVGGTIYGFEGDCGKYSRFHFDY